jgi:cholera toxin transcriptional activator
MENASQQRLFRFGIFEADGQTGELRKQGRRLPLQGQPFEVLVMLLERSGELVTRGEIRERLWAEGTFVDFDHSLNTAVNKIRDVLGDSAASPRFIETLARRGYRFIAPVQVLDEKSEERDLGQRSNMGGEQSPLLDERGDRGGLPHSFAKNANELGTRYGLLSSAAEMPEASHTVVRLLFFLLQLMYFCFYVISLARLRVVEEIVGGAVAYSVWVVVVLIVTAVVGIPTRLYLMSGVGFNAPGLREKFLRLFPVLFPLDELWALAPFLLVQQIGYGLALGLTAILLYVPFAQRSLILMGAGRPARALDKAAGNETHSSQKTR